MITGMPSLPYDLYRADQVRELDRLAIETLAIPAITLMEIAGRSAFEALRTKWPEARRIGVFCGTGNNGGDGYVIARLAVEHGLEAVIMQVGESDRLTATASEAAGQAKVVGVPVRPFRSAEQERFDVIVDAMLGTGLKGPATGPFHDAIVAIEKTGSPVLAIDIPSGLDADTGAVPGVAVRADLTVTFIGLKQGLFTGEGPERAGPVLFEPLGVPDQLREKVPAAARRIDAGSVTELLGPRPRTAHKGNFGHVLVVGGEHGLAGAARMAAEAAARVGAGLVSVATRAGHAPTLGLGRPELMCHGVESAAELKTLLGRASIVAVGPGLGQDRWGREMFDCLLESRLPLVVDADGLNLLASEPARRENWVLTPHPGEAGRLLECSPAEVQENRFAAAASVQASFGGVCLLKGAGSVVVTESDLPTVCTAGNPGMASGGMGDVLTGVIAGLAAQGLDLAKAARAGAALHAAAADRAAAEGERGMLATDLYPHLRHLVNP